MHSPETRHPILLHVDWLPPQQTLLRLAPLRLAKTVRSARTASYQINRDWLTRPCLVLGALLRLDLLLWEAILLDILLDNLLGVLDVFLYLCWKVAVRSFAPTEGNLLHLPYSSPITPPSPLLATSDLMNSKFDAATTGAMLH